MTVPGKISVAQYISEQIRLSGKMQQEISKEVGFATPNMISMIRKGTAKVPLDKVTRIAKAVGIDPIHMFKLCFAEYYPDVWADIQRVFAYPVLTSHEMDILDLVRSANVDNPKVRTDEERQRIRAVIETLKPDNAVND
ncbi:MAG: helix-turn-helix domain-containing protein [Betaproteobacteria bacterium]|nr:helix-turn-helix domain-containing protein [Betaproteobacteria bacterium]